MSADRLVICLLALSLAATSAAADPAQPLASALSEVDAQLLPSGILLDRSLQLVDVARFDGTTTSPELAAAGWRQILHQLRSAGSLKSAWLRTPAEARAAGNQAATVPIAVLDLSYQKLRATARSRADGRIEASDIATAAVFAAAALRSRTFRGSELSFVLPSDWYLALDKPERVQIDFDDGIGWRDARLDETIRVRYARAGLKQLRIRVESAAGFRQARFTFFVEALLTPTPDDTLHVTGAAYLGTPASGDAYVLLAPGHTEIERPAVVIEGFDLDDSMNWDELYALLNQENLVEDLRALGFDAIVLNFDSATEPIQRNGRVVAELLTTLHGMTAAPFPLVGASMGGLCARYALCELESQAIEHGVETFLSFDVPHAGANIPLGVQHWVSFFAGQSTEAEFLLSRLNTPAARQMLLYHFGSTSGTIAAPDPLRAQFNSDLALLGDYPQGPRLVAVANGSGAGTDQGFAAGAQIIHYVYDSLLVDITGNVWAVPNGGSNLIFAGRIAIFLVGTTVQNVSVSGTLPWDNAPGGRRASMAQMDATVAPYGDIVALHPSHGFIPTISALDIATNDPFYDVDGDPDLLAHTSFDAVYFPSSNQEHVAVTAENKVWIMDELLGAPTNAPNVQTVQLHGLRAAPNPFNPSTTLQFALSQRAAVTIDVFDLRGRRLERLLDAAVLDAGTHTVAWRPGERTASGVYRLRVRAGAIERSESVVLVK